MEITVTNKVQNDRSVFRLINNKISNFYRFDFIKFWL